MSLLLCLSIFIHVFAKVFLCSMSLTVFSFLPSLSSCSCACPSVYLFLLQLLPSSLVTFSSFCVISPSVLSVNFSLHYFLPSFLLVFIVSYHHIRHLLCLLHMQTTLLTFLLVLALCSLCYFSWFQSQFIHFCNIFWSHSSFIPSSLFPLCSSVFAYKPCLSVMSVSRLHYYIFLLYSFPLSGYRYG